MKRKEIAATGDLLAGLSRGPSTERLAEGAWLLRSFALAVAPTLLDAVETVAAAAPFRHMFTPGDRRMSVAMTNCGAAGWVTDRAGYRYQPDDPETGRPWPVMPSAFFELAGQAAAAAGFAGFEPDACLINRYAPDTRLTLHQDRNERDFAQPIVSVSLGLAAIFLFGGSHRSDRFRRVPLEHGDVVVWGGASRLAFHGVAPLDDGEHPATGRVRLNLTLRKAL